MQDFGVESCKAKTLSISTTDDNRSDIIINQTCFYARGGGQAWDRGTITSANASFAVEEVRLDENSIVHHIGTFKHGLFEKGNEVECEVDHHRRAANMRLHSAAHIIDMGVADLGLNWIATKEGIGAE